MAREGLMLNNFSLEQIEQLEYITYQESKL